MLGYGVGTAKDISGQIVVLVVHGSPLTEPKGAEMRTPKRAPESNIYKG
ncbi:hypothetical protein [Mesorhizobium sp.]|nr:hypothetical protein [Mesorhizobium sp.]